MSRRACSRIVTLLAAYPLFASAPPKLVTVDIVAVDQRGNLVADLGANELRITDAGRRQEILYFRRGQDVTAERTERSNSSYGTFPHAIAIVLDQLNSEMELAGTEWDGIARVLERGKAERTTYFYVLQKSGGLLPIHDVPESWTGAAAKESTASQSLPEFEYLRHERRARPADFDLSRSKPKSAEWNSVLRRMQVATQTGLQEVAARLSAVPGPKHIVWVGPNIPTGSAIPIYHVEPGSGEEVGKTIVRAWSDAQRGYRMGYEPPANNWDGRDHDIRITCTRPGVTVRARSGYKAVRPVDIADDLRQVAPDLVEVSPFDASAIRFQAATSPDPIAPQFELQIHAEDILFRRNGELRSCELAVQIIRYTRDGIAETADGEVRVDLQLTPEAWTVVLRSGIPLRLAAKPATNASRFRLVVYDRATRAFGTLTLNAAGAPK